MDDAPSAVYAEGVNTTPMPPELPAADWKPCAMCGDRAYTATLWCLRCVWAMRRTYATPPTPKERSERDGVNSVGALQVLPNSALPVWRYCIRPSGTQPDGTVTWSSHVEYVSPNPPYTRNVKKGSFKIHGFGV